MPLANNLHSDNSFLKRPYYNNHELLYILITTKLPVIILTNALNFTTKQQK